MLTGRTSKRNQPWSKAKSAPKVRPRSRSDRSLLTGRLAQGMLLFRPPWGDERLAEKLDTNPRGDRMLPCRYNLLVAPAPCDRMTRIGFGNFHPTGHYE